MFGTSNTASVPAEGFPAVWARLNSPASAMRGQSQRINGKDRAGERGWRELWRALFDACGWERWGQQIWWWTRPLFPYPPSAAAPGTCVLSQHSPRVQHLHCQSQPWGNEHFSAPPISCSLQIPPTRRAKQENSAEAKLGKGTATEANKGHSVIKCCRTQIIKNV